MDKILNLAIEELKQGNLIQSEVILLSILSEESNNADAFFYLGKCFCKQKIYGEAIKNFEKCIQIDPTFIKAYKALRCIYHKSGILQKQAPEGKPIGFEEHNSYLDRAIRFLLEINSRCPDIPEVLISFGKVFEKKREFTNAANCYRKIIQANKNSTITNLAKEALARIQIKEIIEKVG